MVTISIDPEICKHDGICVQVCPEAVLVQKDEKSVPEPLHDALCISCGQCVATYMMPSPTATFRKGRSAQSRRG